MRISLRGLQKYYYSISITFPKMSETVTQTPEVADANGVQEVHDICKYSLRTTSTVLLKKAEEKLLSFLKTKDYKGDYVNIGSVLGEKKKCRLFGGTNECKMWALKFNEPENGNGDSSKVPLVLVHGMGAGSAMWILNIDELTKDKRPVYVVDMLGFGRSSRDGSFSNDPVEVENQYVESFEAFRKTMNLDKFILAGHSMGGFLSTAYAMRYPENLAHLVLVDPWGYHVRDDTMFANAPTYIKFIARLIEPFNPMMALRAAGPLGPRLLRRMRGDLMRKFGYYIPGIEESIADYLFHINAQKPMGENAFHTLMSGFAWAKNPMGPRLSTMDKALPVTFINGESSWVKHVPDEEIYAARDGSKNTAIHYLPGGHHVYADYKDQFNDLMSKIVTGTDGKCSNLNQTL